jgi:hypothetical protein
MHRIVSILVPCLAAMAMAGGCAHAAAGTKPALLPARTLSCNVGHPTNLDFTRDQTADELKFESHHRLSLFLPPIPVRTGEPPDPAYAPEPVDKRTRITLDPDKIAADITAPFNRVVDLWPDRVEMTAPVSARKVKVLVITDYNEPAHKAQLFMTNASDLLTWDRDTIFLGDCEVTLTPARSGKRR